MMRFEELKNHKSKKKKTCFFPESNICRVPADVPTAKILAVFGCDINEINHNYN
jgi:hypothetical protein